MNGLALCAGIGGLELGLARAIPGYRTVCYVEGEAYAAACLVARMAEGRLDTAPVWSDVTSFDGYAWRGVVDIVSAGYPCQPFSVAGKRGGDTDDRHLWPHVRRIVDETQPAVVFLENVAGHVSKGLEQVHDDLLGMGYRIQAGLFSAEEVGAPHARNRLFVLACHVANANCEGQLQQGRALETERGRAVNSGQQAHAWGAEPGIRRVADGVPSRMDRLRALGNAVIPAQAAYAFQALWGLATERKGNG